MWHIRLLFLISIVKRANLEIKLLSLRAKKTLTKKRVEINGRKDKSFWGKRKQSKKC